MKKIYKFGPITFNYDTHVPGRIVKAGIQGEQVFVWAEQGNGNISKVKLVPTGIEYDGDYVDTVFQANGNIVWHIISEK